MTEADDLTPTNRSEGDCEPEPTTEEVLPPLKAIPAILYYQKTYAASCGNNDQKAIRLYKEFENRDKMQRLKVELHAVLKGRVGEELLGKILSASRKGRFGSYSKWAMYVLNALNSRS